MKRILLGAAAALALALAGCGGGGGSSGGSRAVNPAVAGIFKGATASGRTLNAVTSQFGDITAFYSQPGAPATLGGVITSTSTALSGNTFSDNFLNTIVEPPGGVDTGSLVATVVPSTSASGTITHSGGTTDTFIVTRNASSTATASLTAIAGTYVGTTVVATGTATGTVTFTAAGAISGRVPGCTYTGLAAPRGDVNAFDIRIDYQAGCPNLTPVFGAAFYDAAADRLFAAAIPSTVNRYIFMGGPRVP